MTEKVSKLRPADSFSAFKTHCGVGTPFRVWHAPDLRLMNSGEWKHDASLTTSTVLSIHFKLFLPRLCSSNNLEPFLQFVAKNFCWPKFWLASETTTRYDAFMIGLFESKLLRFISPFECFNLEISSCTYREPKKA